MAAKRSENPREVRRKGSAERREGHGTFWLLRNRFPFSGKMSLVFYWPISFKSPTPFPWAAKASPSQRRVGGRAQTIAPYRILQELLVIVYDYAGYCSVIRRCRYFWVRWFTVGCPSVHWKLRMPMRVYVHMHVCVFVCVCVHPVPQVSRGKHRLCDDAALFQQLAAQQLRNPPNCATVQVNTNVPTQSLTLARTLTRTHISDRRACCLPAHAHSEAESRSECRHTHACTRLQSHRLISLRELSTASREMAQEAEHWKQNGVPNQGD